MEAFWLKRSDFRSNWKKNLKIKIVSIKYKQLLTKENKYKKQNNLRANRLKTFGFWSEWLKMKIIKMALRRENRTPVPRDTPGFEVLTPHQWRSPEQSFILFFPY